MENKLSKSKYSLIFLLIIILVVILFFTFNKKNNQNITKIENNHSVLEIIGNKDDLISFSVIPGQKVFGVMKVFGTIKGGYFFEGNILVNILDSNKNILKKGNGTASSDWMTSSPVSFNSNINFTGLPTGPAYIEIQNDDPSDGEGGPVKKILIPIIIN